MNTVDYKLNHINVYRWHSLKIVFAISTFSFFPSKITTQWWYSTTRLVRSKYEVLKITLISIFFVDVSLLITCAEGIDGIDCNFLNTLFYYVILYHYLMWMKR